MNPVVTLLVSVFSVICYARLMNAPARSILPAALAGGAGYVLYDRIAGRGYDIPAYFAASLVVAVTAEILARRMKMPSVCFVLPGIVPLVPGLGLYQTMLYLIEKQYAEAVSLGARTALYAGTIAVTVGVIQAAARAIFARASFAHTGSAKAGKG